MKSYFVNTEHLVWTSFVPEEGLGFIQIQTIAKKLFSIWSEKLKLSNTNPLKTEDELKCSGRVGRSCSTCSTNRVANLVSNYARGKDRELLTTSGANSMSSVSRILCDG